MKTNMRLRYSAQTHEGGTADPHQTALEELTRVVATCMLFENTFYESGSEIAARIEDLCTRVEPAKIGLLAVMARNDWKLRHVPLFLVAQLLKRPTNPGYFYSVLFRVVRRPDEMGELLALVTRGRKGTKKLGKLPNRLVRGLARVFPKFSAYQLEKWNRDAEIKLRDVLFLTHPKPKDAEQAEVWKALAEKRLAPANTWEVGLSAAKTKEERTAVWMGLLKGNALGYMALLMNLRNMVKDNVAPEVIEEVLMRGAKGSWALPFRFVAAARHAPQFATTLSDAMLLALSDAEKLPGTTYLVVDVSGSMDAALSGRSEMSRLDAAGALAVLLREVCARVKVYTFSNRLVEVPNYRGLPLVDAMLRSQLHSGTYLAGALQSLQTGAPTPDRVIVVTDEQSHDGLVRSFGKSGYVINVAPYKPGLNVDSNGWVRINGWSERVVDWVRFNEGGLLTGEGEEDA